MDYKTRTKFYLMISSAVVLLLYVFPFPINAAVFGEIKNFYSDSSYDFKKREEISAELILESNKLYFYIDDFLWQSFSGSERSEIISNLSDLASEFENNIYPKLVSNYGFEWNPGIDNDPKTTILFHRLRKGAGGYFSSGNEYSRLESPFSNEREMIYLNADYISSFLAKSLLAHEFVHLITFNQKERIHGIEEEIWLNEGRAEFAPTLCGYNSPYQGSNLQKRVSDFLKIPSDSITDWQGIASDYGALNLFIHYLVDHYGVKILSDSLYSPKNGIESINYALEKNGFEEDFSQVFTDWTIAVLINDCSLNRKYCYKNQDLRNIKIIPATNFLSGNSPSILSANYITKIWTGNWHKILGGQETLTFEFGGEPGGNFKVPYVICNNLNDCSVYFLALDENQRGEIIIKEFNKKYNSFTIVPLVQGSSSNSSSIKPDYSFSWQIKMSQEFQEEGELIEQLLAQIVLLKAEVAQLQDQIAAILEQKPDYCQRLDNNLYFGLRDNQEVRCLQEFLKNQGLEIYPEGLVTGNFLSLTKIAVIRFQEKYTSEILAPFGLEKGTGYVGPKSRAKINELIDS